eukprot:9019248-Pyramimonas_sp.AAC.1
MPACSMGLFKKVTKVFGKKKKPTERQQAVQQAAAYTADEPPSSPQQRSALTPVTSNRSVGGDSQQTSRALETLIDQNPAMAQALLQQLTSGGGDLLGAAMT